MAVDLSRVRWAVRLAVYMEVSIMMNSHQMKRRNRPEGAVGRVSVPCNTNPGGDSELDHTTLTVAIVVCRILFTLFLVY